MPSRRFPLPCISIAILGLAAAGMGCGQTGIIMTVAGGEVEGLSGDGGPATLAELNHAAAVAVDSTGNIYIADTGNHRIRKVTAGTGIITTVAGGANPINPSLGLSSPVGVAVDASGNLYIADSCRIMKWSATSGTLLTMAGSYNNCGFSGDGGPASSATFTAGGVALDSGGNIYIADTLNNRIRMVSAGTGITTTVAGNSCLTNMGELGFYGCYAGDGGLATNASLNRPTGVAVDSGGNLYIADTANSVVREVAAGTGIITTVAGGGNATNGVGDGGPAKSAVFNDVTNVAVDGAGNLYISDTGHYRIREVMAGTGIITTVAGIGGSPGLGGDGGPATSAQFDYPLGVAIDIGGDLYIADSSGTSGGSSPLGYNSRIRAVFFGSNPVVTSLSPSSIVAGGPAFNLTVTGTNFVSGSTVTWNGSPLATAFVSANQLTASVPANLTANVAGADVGVTNPGSVSDNLLGFAVNAASPVLGSLNPASVTAAASATGFTLTVNGSGFNQGSVVSWTCCSNPPSVIIANLSTTFVSTTQLTAFVPGADVLSAGIATVYVVNPATVVNPNQTFSAPSMLNIYPPGVSFTGASRIPHVAAGGGWETTIVIKNLDVVPVNYILNCWGDNGAALPVQFENLANGAVGMAFGTLPVGGTIFLRSIYPSAIPPQPLVEGWAEAGASGKVGVMAIFDYFPSGGGDQQGSVTGTTPAGAISMPYDNTQGYIMGLALANANTTQPLTVGLTFATDQGTRTTGQITVPAHGHTAFVLANSFPATAGTRGSIQFSASSPDLTVLGERFTPSLSFTTVGTFQPSASGTSIGSWQTLSFTNAQRIAHIADGAGWSTTFAIENLDTVPVNYAFNFWDDNGVALPIRLMNADGTPAATSGTLAVGATYFLQSPGVSTSLLEGWAEAASSGSIGVMAIFKYSAPGAPVSQGTVIGTTSASTIDMPYDNTQQSIMGVALANTNPTQPLTVALTFNADDGTQSNGQITLPPHGHTAFVLSNSFPATAYTQGSIHFTTTSPDLTVLGERFAPINASTYSFTTLGTFQ